MSRSLNFTASFSYTDAKFDGFFNDVNGDNIPDDVSTLKLRRSPQVQWMRSVGKPMHGVEMKVIDAAGETLAPGTIGDIAIRVQANMRKYWNRPEATAETIDADGWRRTGDASYRDEDGYFYLHNR